MKSLQIPYTYYPDPTGGTEVYVAALGRELQRRGSQVVITAPGQARKRYSHEGLIVQRFPTSLTAVNLSDLYGEGDRGAEEAFLDILDEERPDLVHFHAFTAAVSTRLVRAAKREGAAVVFTYHTPTVSCQRGTLLRWGINVCDGELDVSRCTACSLQGLGGNRFASGVLARTPTSLGKWVNAAGLAGGVWTALQMRWLLFLRHGAFRTLVTEADCIVSLCDWSRSLLLRNGVSPEKLVSCPHGIALDHDAVLQGFSNRLQDGFPRPGIPLRIAFLGRLHPTKGPDLLIRSILALPDAALELHVYGVRDAVEASVYEQDLRVLAANDCRIHFLPPVAPCDVVSLLKEYDVLAVPSQWLETGPLVVLEAFAAGTPVIGSRLGGIADLVQHERNGLLVDFDSVPAWTSAIRRCVETAGLISDLRQGIEPPRSMGAVAEEMLAVYERVLSGSDEAGCRPRYGCSE